MQGKSKMGSSSGRLSTHSVDTSIYRKQKKNFTYIIIEAALFWFAALVQPMLWINLRGPGGGALIYMISKYFKQTNVFI